MLVTTTETVEGGRITKYIGVVSGEAIMGANFLRDFLAGITDIIGGRSGAYEKSIQEGKEVALKEMVAEAQKRGANAVVGINFGYEAIQLEKDKGSLLMVACTGTAVIVE